MKCSEEGTNKVTEHFEVWRLWEREKKNQNHKRTAGGLTVSQLGALRTCSVKACDIYEEEMQKDKQSALTLLFEHVSHTPGDWLCNGHKSVQG